MIFRLRLWLFDALMALATRIEPEYRWQHRVDEKGLYFWREPA